MRGEAAVALPVAVGCRVASYALVDRSHFQPVEPAALPFLIPNADEASLHSIQDPREFGTHENHRDYETSSNSNYQDSTHRYANLVLFTL